MITPVYEIGGITTAGYNSPARPTAPDEANFTFPLMLASVMPWEAMPYIPRSYRQKPVKDKVKPTSEVLKEREEEKDNARRFEQLYVQAILKVVAEEYREEHDTEQNKRAAVAETRFLDDLLAA